MNNLKDLILKSDPREFLKWEVIRYTMFVGDAKYINEEFNFIQNFLEREREIKINSIFTDDIFDI